MAVYDIIKPANRFHYFIMGSFR